MNSLVHTGSSPRRRFRALWCRIVGHRLVLVDVEYWAKADRGAWDRHIERGLMPACSRCLMHEAFTLPLPEGFVGTVDAVRASF